MYHADFICTYNKMDNDDDRNLMYQIQLLQAFGMCNFDENEINKKTTELYHHLKDYSQIKEILEEGVKLNAQMNLSDEVMFMCLFSYQFFDLFHKCLIDYFTTGTILDDSKNKMIERIKSD